MDRLFHKLFGRESRLAVDVALLAPDSFHEHSDEFDFDILGRLTWWVEGRNLTASVGSGSDYVDFVEWDIVSTLAWFANNWDAIFHEETLPPTSGGQSAAEAITQSSEKSSFDDLLSERTIKEQNQRFRWWTRHSIQSARDGGFIPNIVFRRLIDDLEISWDNTYLIAGSERRFVEAKGSYIVSLNDAHAMLNQFLCETSLEGINACPNGVSVAELQRLVSDLDILEHRKEKMRWLSGFNLDRVSLISEADSAALEREVKSLIEEVEEPFCGVYAHSAATMLFRSLSPKIREADLHEIRRLLQASQKTDAAGGDLVLVSRKVSQDSTRTPWAQALELASEFREILDIAPTKPFDSEAILKRLGIRLAEAALSDGNLRALCFRGPGYQPCIAINKNTSFQPFPHAREMDIAHELCHLAYDQGVGKPLGVISGPWAPRYLEQRANAFAAYLRLPVEGIRITIGNKGTSVSMKDVQKLMSRYKVGVTVATWNLRNLGWIDDIERDSILESFESQPVE